MEGEQVPSRESRWWVRELAKQMAGDEGEGSRERFKVDLDQHLGQAKRTARLARVKGDR